MKTKFYYLLFFISCCGVSGAQQVVSSGGYSMESGVSIDWILGGNLHTIPAYDVSNILQESKSESEFPFKVYPTLTYGYFTIEIAPSDSAHFIFELCDITGTVSINSACLNQPTQEVDIADLPNGIYILKLWLPGKDRLLHIEKIIKL
jgi:hypothetical protein